MKSTLFAVTITLASIPLFADENPASGPIWMMVVHDVENYDAWRDVFDSGLSTRQSAGELHFEINRYPDDPHQIIAIFQWDKAEKARAFVDDPAVRNAMRAAGVVSDPVVTFYEASPSYDGG